MPSFKIAFRYGAAAVGGAISSIKWLLRTLFSDSVGPESILSIVFEEEMNQSTVTNAGDGSGSLEVFNVTEDSYVTGVLSSGDGVTFFFEPTSNFTIYDSMRLEVSSGAKSLTGGGADSTPNPFTVEYDSFDFAADITWATDPDIGRLTSGNGTVTVNTGSERLELANESVIGDGAAAYLKNPIEKNVPGKFVSVFALVSGSDPFVSIRIQESTPVVTEAATVLASTIMMVAGSASGMQILYYDESDVLTYWNGTIWTTTSSFYSPPGYATTTLYRHEFEWTDVQWRYVMKSADGATTHTTADWVPFVETQDNDLDLYMSCGDQYTNAHVTNSTVNLIERYPL